MKFSEFDMQHFLALRSRMFNIIEKELNLDGHCKSYEGALAIQFPSYFEDGEDPEISIELSCYLAPINGRSALYRSLNELEEMLDLWDAEFMENNLKDATS